jgi:hypothetical protein
MATPFGSREFGAGMRSVVTSVNQGVKKMAVRRRGLSLRRAVRLAASFVPDRQSAKIALDKVTPCPYYRARAETGANPFQLH